MTRRVPYTGMMGVSMVVIVAASLTGTSARQVTGAAVRIDGDDLGGVVTSAKGPEAGVWVIAETSDLRTKYRKIVVTDDRGRYVLPDLPKATYDVWVRGYGLVDSPKVKAAPGKLVNLTAVVAPDAHAAAQYYPASYWFSLVQIPPRSDFPGTGPDGNSISPNITSQAQWIAQLKGCMVCHQLGSKATREIPKSLGSFPSSGAAWNRRVQSGQFGVQMSGALSQFGRPRVLAMFADWTDRIAAGEVPPAPPRPEGIERNLVLTLWDWSDQVGFVHDTASTDKRDPRVNANGPVYSAGRLSPPDLNILNPSRNAVEGVSAPVRSPEIPRPDAFPKAPQRIAEPSPYWGEEIIWSGDVLAHNPMLDHRGRVWITQSVRPPVTPPFCQQGSSHPSAMLFPLDDRNNYGGDDRQLSVFDPRTNQFTLIDTCFGTHSLHFAHDANQTLWVSTNVGGQVLGFLNTKLFDETHDEQTSQGWIPFILDTNGNGKQDVWVEPNEPVDPSKDKRIRGGSYGIVPNPIDGSVWVANARSAGGAIIRVNPGSNPPRTALSEVYEPPIPGATPRGIDVDRNGLIWTAFAGSGHIASFDRRKCKVLNGPTATGQHCPEGWTLYPTPAPTFKGAADLAYGTDMHYRQWVDQFNTLGLGENVPIANGTNSDSLLALLPDTGTFVVLRVPYPIGFYSRSVDGRIDDPKGGWKGRGLWANYGQHTPWHIEGGRGTTSKAVKFQMRPDPLAK